MNIYPSEEELGSETPKSCPTCLKGFANTMALRLHRIKVHHVISSEGDRRLFTRSAEIPETIEKGRYFCPAETCRKKEASYKDMKTLRQHFIRAHLEKSLGCECGTRFALEKDRKYHKKTRCPLRTVATGGQCFYGLE